MELVLQEPCTHDGAHDRLGGGHGESQQRHAGHRCRRSHRGEDRHFEVHGREALQGFDPAPSLEDRAQDDEQGCQESRLPEAYHVGGDGRAEQICGVVGPQRPSQEDTTE